jgi:mycofactocin precursor
MEYTSLSAHEFPPPEQIFATDAATTSTQQAVPVDEVDALEEIEDELIIEDFTIDGICGVY